ncbi:hypothetical protein E2C01_089054 [Portunus trituberculatus]|uniref:Uncharacterized protein n=1 Tax=Portunus trituberculatus TaxID=210409 RepID=A0A5B7JLH6_PORTR|nr:hypothetical protein [Portunus trituberculatus]
MQFTVKAGRAVVVLHVTKPDLNCYEPRIKLTDRFALRVDNTLDPEGFKGLDFKGAKLPTRPIRGDNT